MEPSPLSKVAVPISGLAFLLGQPSLLSPFEAWPLSSAAVSGRESLTSLGAETSTAQVFALERSKRAIGLAGVWLGQVSSGLSPSSQS